MEPEQALTDRRSSCFSSFTEDRALHSSSTSTSASAILQNAAHRESTGFSFCGAGLTRTAAAEAGTGTISFTAERTCMTTPQQGDLIVGSKNPVDSSKKDEPKVLGSFRGSRFKSTKLLLGHPRRVLRGDDSTGSNESMEAGEIQQVENKEKPLVPASKLLDELVNLKEELENLRKQDDNKSSPSDKNVGNGEHEDHNNKKLVEREDFPEVCSQQRQETLSAEEPEREEVRSERPDSGAQRVPMENNGVYQENARGSNNGDFQQHPQLKDEVKEVPKQESTERNLPGDLKEVDSRRARENERQRENERFVWVNNKRYQKLGKIGSGGSSHVFKVIAQDCTIYALKRIILKGRDHQTACGFHQEIEYLERLRGKRHIVQLIDYEVTDKNIFRSDYVVHGEIQNDVRIYMVLEYGEIDLARMLERKKNEEGEIDENWLRLHWEHILKAVHTIHEERIVHADLKPANFLLVQGRLKLIDFGIAKAIQNDTTNIVRESQVGTLNYMSPEAFMMNSRDENGTVKCGRASDIWSLGCILYQMVYGRTPFSHLSFYQKITEITNPKHVIEFPPVSNPLILEVMKTCLVWDKSKRPRIPQLLEHPFLRPRALEDQQLRDALVQSFNRYIKFKGSLALTEMIRKAAKGNHNSDAEQLDEVLIPFVRLYMHKAGKPALHELLTSLL